MTDETEEPFTVYGFALIGDMSKEELIGELVSQWRKDLSEKDMIELKKMVIAVRMHHIQDRMIQEAGLKQTPGFLGFPTLTEENDDGE